MTTDITGHINSCPECQRVAPAQQRETLQSHDVPKEPWTKVGVDLFKAQESHYLVIVSYITDYLEYERLVNQSTLPVINTLKKCFGHLGIPKLVMTDNGSQFTSHQFATFSQNWDVPHITSSLHYAQSNGKAEPAVKIAKRILHRCCESELALLEYRNTPKEAGHTSPIQQLMRQTTRSVLPEPTKGSPQQLAWEEKQLKKWKDQQKHDRSAHDLLPLRQGQPVLVRDWRSHHRQWRESVIEIQFSDRSYSLRVNDDIIRRNRRDIRPLVSALSAPAENQTLLNSEPVADRTDEMLDSHTDDNRTATRRSQRMRKPPQWLQDYVTN